MMETRAPDTEQAALWRVGWVAAGLLGLVMLALSFADFGLY